MKKAFICLLLVVLSVPYVMGQPHTEIYVFDFKIWHDQYSLSNPRNVTSNPGFYDNQPYFMPDGDSFLYASADETEKTDVYIYDLRAQERRRLTYTPEVSEFSPTVTPDETSFSCVILEEDGTQKLWRYFTNAPVASLVTDIEKVGYHAWYDDHRIALFIVDEDEHHTLHIVDLETGEDRTIAEDIGTGLQHIPGQNKVSFVDIHQRHHWKIKAVDMETFEVSDVIDTFDDSQNYTWTKDGILITGDGTSIYKYDPQTDEGWVEMANLSEYGLHRFSRIAVNPQVSRLAVVVEE